MQDRNTETEQEQTFEVIPVENVDLDTENVQDKFESKENIMESYFGIKIATTAHNKSLGKDAVLVSAFGINITQRDIDRLHDDDWLNDNIINFYFHMIAHNNDSSVRSVFAYSTFFYVKLLKSGYSGVKDWNKVDLFSHRFIFIPIHIPKHWCLVVVDIPNCRISYYDSNGGDNDHCLDTIEQFLKDAHWATKQTDLPKFEKENKKDIPRQTNAYDCGVFVCQFADFIARNDKAGFTQESIAFLRLQMIVEIILFHNQNIVTKKDTVKNLSDQNCKTAEELTNQEQIEDRSKLKAQKSKLKRQRSSKFKGQQSSKVLTLKCQSCCFTSHCEKRLQAHVEFRHRSIESKKRVSLRELHNKKDLKMKRGSGILNLDKSKDTSKKARSTKPTNLR
jgi:sentrin-specific protease 1